MTRTVTLPHWIRGERPIFACYHRPDTGARDLGVLLCAPFGYEMMCTHRALRHLAERLAGAGFPTLRFDYDGTGDSSGGDADPERVLAWLGSIDAGVHALRGRGAKRIALVGVRFGALLAAEYAKRNPVEALVLVSPPATGRAYLRELRAFQAMRSPWGPALSNGQNGLGEEAVGYQLATETASQLEMTSIVGDAMPARRVLIAARDDVEGREQKLVDQLARLGSEVTLTRTAGYAAMMTEDPVKSVVPDLLWSEVARWLSEDASSTAGAHGAEIEQAVACVRAADGAPAVLEEIVQMEGMMGVLSSPLDHPRLDAPVILLPNVGANHHVGCNRIYVDFARRWAAIGFSVLRFDLVGIGDTPSRRGREENALYSDACAADVRHAMDWLAQTHGFRRFALGGICSGAYVSYYAALADERVDCVMLVNPLTFHWREGDSLDVRMRATLKSTHFYRQALLNLRTWRRAARGEVHLRAIATKLAARAWTRVLRWPTRWFPRDTEVGAGFRRLCARGTRVILVCGENDGSRDVVEEHLGQDARRLWRNRNFRFVIARDTDHTFSPIAARRDLTETFTAHLLETKRSVPSPPANGPPSAHGG
jgi:pimeloyl-ACP methyl ester carboxylesterase